MRPEYQSLAVICLFFLFAWFPSSVGKMKLYGKKWVASNRAPVEGKSLTGWAGRAERAHNNLKDNIPGFIAAIALLGLTNGFDHTTTIASILYVVVRIGHFISYTIGNVPARAAFFFAGLISNSYLLIKVLI